MRIRSREQKREEGKQKEKQQQQQRRIREKIRKGNAFLTFLPLSSFLSSKHIFGGHSGQICAVRWRFDQDLLIVGCTDGSVSIWDIASGTLEGKAYLTKKQKKTPNQNFLFVSAKGMRKMDDHHSYLAYFRRELLLLHFFSSFCLAWLWSKFFRRNLRHLRHLWGSSDSRCLAA